jgi:GSH-dependent disulfide-bond oxidoreductase
MIELYYWPTPNGHKITMFLEEAGLEYAIHPVDISAGDQFKPDFLAISPNNRMPAIIDTAPADGGKAISVFESGAILLYLAEKTGRFLPKDTRGRKTATEWLFWQVGGLGPMAGQNHHFGVYAPTKIPYAIDRYVKETNRLYGVLDRHLENRAFIVGDTYSIGDMASYPWVVSASSRIWTTSRTCGAGSMRCAGAPARNVPTRKANHTRAAPRLRKRERRSFSGKQRAGRRWPDGVDRTSFHAMEGEQR